MPITTSAKKALRGSKKKRSFNLRRKSAIDSTLKSFRKLVAEKKVNEAEAMLPALYKAFDKGAKTGYIKSNTASRIKARSAAAIKRVKAK